MQDFNIKIPVRIYSYSELPSAYQHLIDEAKEQTKFSYAPYSHFNVGAAVLLKNGNIIGGNNQENIAYPSGLCAERVAIFAANAQFTNQTITAIAIAAFTEGDFTLNPISPCGACRQVLAESETRFQQNIDILLYGEKEIYLIKKAALLLPISFKMNQIN